MHPIVSLFAMFTARRNNPVGETTELSQKEAKFNDSKNQQTLNFLQMSFYKPSALFRFFYRQIRRRAGIQWDRGGGETGSYMCLCIYVYVRARRDWETEKENEIKREREKNGDERRKKERNKERGIWPRWWMGLPGFRQEDVTVNPRPPASDEPTLSLARPAFFFYGPCVRVYAYTHARGHTCIRWPA